MKLAHRGLAIEVRLMTGRVGVADPGKACIYFGLAVSTPQHHPEMHVTLLEDVELYEINISVKKRTHNTLFHMIY
jgi:hypothetical protein